MSEKLPKYVVIYRDGHSEVYHLDGDTYHFYARAYGNVYAHQIAKALNRVAE